MNYFKLIDNGNLIGVVSGSDFRRFQQKHKTMLSCTEDEGQYVQLGDLYYRDKWMKSPAGSVSFVEAEVVRIDKEEFDLLHSAIESGEELEELSAEIIDPTTTESEIITDTVNGTLEYVSSSKISEMSARCNGEIMAGADVLLSDGDTHHFSFKYSDQINIMRLYNSTSSDEALLVYHADGEPVREYTKEDIVAVYESMVATITKHTVYFNCLKTYIMSLTDAKKISGITYGSKIPAKYRTSVYKAVCA